MRSTQNASKGAERYRVGDTRDVALCSWGGVGDEAGPVIAGADRGPGGSDSEGGGAGIGCCGCSGRGGGDGYGYLSARLGLDKIVDQGLSEAYGSIGGLGDDRGSRSSHGCWTSEQAEASAGDTGCFACRYETGALRSVGRELWCGSESNLTSRSYGLKCFSFSKLLKGESSHRGCCHCVTYLML